MEGMVTVTANGQEYIIPAEYAKPGMMDEKKMVIVKIVDKLYVIPKEWDKWLAQLADIIDAQKAAAS